MTQSEKNQPQMQSSQQRGEASRAIRRDEPRTSRTVTSSQSVWSPFAGVRRMMDEMDRLFSGGSPFGSSLLAPFTTGATSWVPPVEVIERGNRLEVRADLPGMTPEDVQVEVRDDALFISGTRQEKHETNEGGVVLCERTYGSFQRTIPIPSGVDPNQVEARFEDGVLEISLPISAQQARGRSVEIKRGGRRDGGPGGQGGGGGAMRS